MKLGLESGPTLVMLHGFGGRPQDWAPVVSELTQKFRILIPSLSEIIFSVEPIRFSAQVDAVGKWLESLTTSSENPIFLVGQSYGGALALALEIKFPLLFCGALVLNPMPFSPLKQIEHPLLRTFLMAARVSDGFSSIHGRTTWGQLLLREIGGIFHAISQEERVSLGTEPRRVRLIEAAVQRFLWLDRAENWEDWIRRPSSTPETSNSRLFFLVSRRDPLFSMQTFEGIAESFGSQNLQISETGDHLLAESDPAKVVETTLWASALSIGNQPHSSLSSVSKNFRSSAS